MFNVNHSIIGKHLNTLDPSTVIICDGDFSVTAHEVLSSAKEIVARTYDTLIAVNGRKGAAFVRDMLAVMAAGRTALLIPNNLPDERQNQILLESKCKTIIKSRHGMKLEFAVITVEDEHGLGEGYIIYTSGSTGKPKGVHMALSSVMPVIHQQIEAFGYDHTSNVFLFPSLTFDAAISDILCTVFSNGVLHIDPLVEQSPVALIEFLNTKNINIIDFPPSLLHLYDLGSVDSLESVIIGGETPPYEEVMKLSETTDVFVVYGPSECGICTSYIHVTEDFTLDESDKWNPLLLGEPLDGVDYHIVDGELCIMTKHMMEGYYLNPELTETKMTRIEVNCGRNRIKPKYAFKTGDAVELDEHSRYTFHGRIDRQFKKTGALVCPEEIEKVINSFDGVSSSYVGLVDDSIVAVYEGCGEIPIHSRMLTLLNDKLPRYMIPSKFVDCSVKKNQSGKVDLQAMQKIIEGEFFDALEEKAVVSEDVLPIVTIIRQHGYTVEANDWVNDYPIDSMDIISICLEAEKVGLQIKHGDFFLPIKVGKLGAKTELSRTPREAITRFNNIRDKSKVLVFGATGKLGSMLVQELEKTGHEVTTIGRRNCDITMELNGDGVVDTKKLRKFKEFTVVVNAMAIVNDLMPYQLLEKINVSSALEIAEYARIIDAKYIHISSLSVFTGYKDLPRNRTMIFNEVEPPLDIPYEFISGYAESKWVADYMISKNYLGHSKIIRLGLLTPSIKNPVFDKGDGNFLKNVIRDMKTDGKALNLDKMHYQIDITPIDFAAKTIAAIINEGDYHTKYHHITSERRMVYNQEGYDLISIDDKDSLKHLRYLPLDRYNNDTCIFELSGGWTFGTRNTSNCFPKFDDDEFKSYIEEISRSAISE